MNLNEKGSDSSDTSSFLIHSMELGTLRMTTCVKLSVDNNFVVLIGERPFFLKKVRSISIKFYLEPFYN